VTREHRFSVDGRVLAVTEAGNESGPAVIVSHGTPGSRLLWRELIEDAEARGMRLISYDRPGYGGSDPHPGRNVADAAEDVTAIADELGIDRVAVEGGSGGGPHALACAALLPERVVAAASLAGVAPYAADRLDWLDGMGQDNLDEFEATVAGREELERYLRGQADAMLSAEPDAIVKALRSLLSPPDLAVLAGEVADYFQESTRVGIEDRLDGWIDDDFELLNPWGFELEDIRIPVQLWHGVQDRFVPIAHGRWLAERIPGVDAHFSEEDGHLTIQLRRIKDVHARLLEHFG
jgi:pimeloyl-ACP methyl ester carboxylesterase